MPQLHTNPWLWYNNIILGWCTGKCLPGTKSQSDCKTSEEDICLFENWIFSYAFCVFERVKQTNYISA